jgi:signal transduction histidine kinase
MNTLTKSMARRYQSALARYLKQGDRSRLTAARTLGSELQAAGSDLQELASIHERTLVAKNLLERPARERERIIRLSGDFYAAVITPIEKAERGRTEVFISRGKLIEQLSHRTIELAVSNVERSLEITQRKMVELALRKNEKHGRRLLEQANRLREHSRRLSQRLVRAQEDERKKISHELHDVIAQMLMGINIHLATLKKEACLNTEGLSRNITRTQRLVLKSVDIVHQFARRLRPTVLDDLGLIPALQSYMKDMAKRNGLRMHLHGFAGIDQLDVERRTALFRVAQEALTNVARHAHASKATVRIINEGRRIRMVIHDDGKAFQVQRVLVNPGHRHLGIIGMRERLELLDGVFRVESVRGKGTTITAEIPLGRNPPTNDEPENA